MDRTTHIKPEQAKTVNAHISAIRFSQMCMLCENTRDLPEGMCYSNTPWVCDDCKDAIAFIKELKHEQESFDPLKPILD